MAWDIVLIHICNKYETLCSYNSKKGEDMKKTKVYILIYLSIMLPVFLSAAPIDKYYVPPQQQQVTQQQAPSSRAQTSKQDVYTEFRKKAGKLSPEERGKLKSSFQNKRDTASKNQNSDAARYYQELINILNTF